MTGKLFGRTNANDCLFNIETQEGSDILDGDEGVASIGDATLAHVQTLSSLGRMAYDEFVHMPDGNIFRVEDNPRWDDPDEFNLKNKSQMDRFLQWSKLPESARAIYEEALDREGEKGDSEDVMDHPEELIPYEDWEKFGGLSKYWDIPPTPKPKLVFAGSSRPMFYDELPDEHPLVSFITRVLSTLDRYAWHEILTEDGLLEHNLRNRNKQVKYAEGGPSYLYSDGTTDYLLAEEYCGLLVRSIQMERAPDLFRVHTLKVMTGLVMKIAQGSGDPTDNATAALKELDRFSSNFYKKVVIKKTTEQDPLFIHICKLGQKAISMAKKGKDMYNEVKRFGQDLFENGFVTEMMVKDKEGNFHKEAVVERARRHHWAKYRSIKEQLEKIREKQFTKTLSDAAQSCLDKIAAAKNDAIKARNLRKFTTLSTELINSQKIGKVSLTKRELEVIWNSYNNSKREVSSHINEVRVSG
jgi:hypothetical protein